MDTDNIHQALRALRAENEALRLEKEELSQRIADLEGASSRGITLMPSISSAEKARLEKGMRLLLMNSPDYVLFLNKGGKVVFCTNAFLQRMNLSGVTTIVDRHYEELFRRFAQEKWIDRFTNALNTAMEQKKTISLDTAASISGRDKRRYILWITPLLSSRGILEGVLVVFHDQTELLEAKKQAERADRGKTEVLTTLSHEIRTSMSAVIGLSDIINQGRLSVGQRKALSAIDGSSRMLLSLMNTILDLSDMDAGRLVLNENYFSLHTMLGEVMELYRMVFADRHIAFISEFSGNAPDVVLGDEKRVRQILTSLLDTARNATKEGRVLLKVYMDAQQNLCFDVSDTGIGIRAKDIPLLFKPYERLNKAHNKSLVGTDLELAMASRLCELMGGGISVSSEYGTGSTFTVTLPLPQGTADHLTGRPKPDIAISAPHARVLVVDDVDVNLLVATVMLQAFGVQCDSAHTGEEAVEMAMQTTYDLIFMDHMMPGMDGVEATQAIRINPGPSRKTPIIALTANSAPGARDMFLSSGFNDFIAKPIDRSTLAACLQRWLRPALFSQTI